MNKKYLMFGIVGLFAMVIVTAAVIEHYGSIQQSFNVEQAVVLTCPSNDCVESTGSLSELAPITLLSEVYSVKNVDPSNSRNVELVTSCLVDNGGGNVYCAGGEVDTSYVGVLELTSKDSSDWTATDDLKATLYYTIVGNEFKYKVDVTTGTLTNYVVVYYPDVSATGTDGVGKKPWNIANAVNLGDVTDVWTTSDLATSLPITGDYNANPIEGDSYCGGENGYDHFEHCAGAKIWLMSQTNFTNKAWNPNAWLFETDLIVYSNDANGIITLPAGGGFDFMVENIFAGTGDYKITTEVLPVA